MLNQTVIYKDEEGEVIAEYERDGKKYVTILFLDREINWVELSKVTLK